MFRSLLQRQWQGSHKRMWTSGVITTPQLQQVLNEALVVTTSKFPRFFTALVSSGWELEGSNLGGEGFVVAVDSNAR